MATTPNTFDSNITRMLIRIFLEKFETARVLSKNVNTQLLTGKFSPKSGTIVDFKRPTDYTTQRTDDGNITNGAPHNGIVTGKASGVVQKYFTVDTDFNEVDQALKMDQLDELLAPMATRIATDLELDFAQFMLKNTALKSGTVGTPITSWVQVANAKAHMRAAGVPMDSRWMFAVNEFTEVALSDIQRILQAGGKAGDLIDEAHRMAVIAENFGGMRVMSATTLGSYNTSSGATRSGTLSATPIATYLNAKDTMTQVLAVTGLQSGLVVPAGTTVQIASRFRRNLSTRKIVIDAAGNKVQWSATVTTDVTLAGGSGNLIVTGPAIFEADGQYNTVDTPLLSGDNIVLGGAASKQIQPNLFWHKQAFSIGSVPLNRLFATDEFGKTEDGLELRVTRFSDGLANKQKVRFDLLPAYAVLNPFFAGQSFG